MSAINGDKARFHRKRKAKIARRARNRERLTGLGVRLKPEIAGTDSGKKKVSA